MSKSVHEVGHAHTHTHTVSHTHTNTHIHWNKAVSGPPSTHTCIKMNIVACVVESLTWTQILHQNQLAETLY